MFALLLILQAAAAAPTTTPSAPWTAVSRTNPATGATATSAFAMSRDGTARLTVRCDTVKEPVVSIQMRSRTPMAAGPDQVVTFSADGSDPIPAAWQFPGVAMLNTNPNAVTGMVAALAKAHKVVLTTGEGPLATSEEFEGPASADGIKAVLAACGYELGVVPPPPAKK